MINNRNFENYEVQEENWKVQEEIISFLWIK